MTVPDRIKRNNRIDAMAVNSEIDNALSDGCPKCGSKITVYADPAIVSGDNVGYSCRARIVLHRAFTFCNWSRVRRYVS